MKDEARGRGPLGEVAKIEKIATPRSFATISAGKLAFGSNSAIFDPKTWYVWSNFIFDVLTHSNFLIPFQLKP
jgi:hypothetical protein